MGAARELKRASEGYWGGKISREQLLATGADRRRRHWQLQRDIGIRRIPANDFSFYDRMLDTCAMVGAVPCRYGWTGDWVDPGTYFAMARGSQGKGRDVTAMEMTKWFDTNYHYIVPELERGQRFRMASAKPANEYREAKALGIDATTVLIGPLTFLLLAKAKGGAFDRLSLLDALLPVYRDVLESLAAVGGARLLAAAYAVRPRSRDQARRGAEELARIRQTEAAGSRRTGEERPEGDGEQQPGREIASCVDTNQQRRGAAPGRLGNRARQRAHRAVRCAPEVTAGSSPVSDDDDRLVPPDDGSASRAAQAQ